MRDYQKELDAYFNGSMNTYQYKKPQKMRILKSRTFWTLVLTFVINGIAAVHNEIPAGLVMPVDAALSLLAIYFHTNPHQNFNE